MRRLAILSSLLISSSVWAGGFEFPGNGTEALGRGAAFTAKADDPTAIEYNIAGLARQRGTRLLLNGNLSFHTYEFQRSGTYPAEDIPPGEMGSGLAGQPFPMVKNNAGPFFAPFLGITTDFGKLERWTFAIGVYGPSSYGHRDFGLTVKNAAGQDVPSPGRYDLVSANLLIVFPTLAAAVRATKWLDIGIALQLVVGHFDLTTVSFTDLGPGLCYSKEFPGCDAKTHIVTTGTTATAALGLMFHPHRNFDIGINVRGQANVKTSGEIDTPGPGVRPLDPPAKDKAEFNSQLPWVLRFGLRYKFLAPDNFERGDLELNAVYEAWNAAEGEGDTLSVPQLAFFSDINAKVVHRYQDTISIRLGGAYNIRLPKGVFTIRLGSYYDSAATKKKDTRLDFDTMDKWGFTGGLGYTIRGVSINLAYGYIYSPDRTVTNGELRSLNGVNGSTIASDGNPLPIINNGTYHANTQILSIGLTLAFDEIMKKNRVYTY
jgi:long-subunit fatty acid transport protein